MDALGRSRLLYSIAYLEGNTNGRHDAYALRRIVDERAAYYGAAVELRNFSMANGRYIDNFYLMLSDFLVF